MEMPDNKIKRIITRFAFCIIYVLSIYISCDDDDEHHHHDEFQAYPSLWQQDWNKEYQVVLTSEVQPVFDDTFLRNPESLTDETFKATDRDERIVRASLDYNAGKYKEQLKLQIEGKL